MFDCTYLVLHNFGRPHRYHPFHSASINSQCFLLTATRKLCQSCCQGVMDLPPSTHWHRTHGRPTRAAKAASQQYLTEEEEAVLWDFITAKRQETAGFRLRHNEIRNIALLIRHRRHSVEELCMEDFDCDTKRPNKDWSSAFFTRMGHSPKAAKRPKLARTGATDMVKLLEDFNPLIQQTKILRENVYYLFVTGGIFLKSSVVRELLSVDDMEEYLKRTPTGKILTIVECVSLEHEILCPLVVWPATASSYVSPKKEFHHRSTISKTGRFDNVAFSDWLEQTFDPDTYNRACGRPRFLVLGRLANYCSKRIAEFCQKRKIIICEARGTLTKMLPPGIAMYDESTALAVKTLQQEFIKRRDSRMDFWPSYKIARQKALEAWKGGMTDRSTLRALVDPKIDVQPSSEMPKDERLMSSKSNDVEQSLVSSAEGRKMSAAEFEFLASVFQHDLACTNMDEATKNRVDHFINASKAIVSALQFGGDDCACSHSCTPASRQHGQSRSE
jgi:hypothetical protein